MSYARGGAASQFGMISKGLLAVAAVGWGLFAYSAVLSGSYVQTIQDEIARLRQEVETATAERDQLAQERDQNIQVDQNLQSVREQIEASMQELQQLDTLRANVSQAIEQARIQLTAPSNQPLAREGSPTGGATSAAPLSKQQIRAAQEALVDLGYGNLEADAMLGSSTSKAVEAFERAKGLPVTGKLGSATVEALRTHVASVVQ